MHTMNKEKEFSDGKCICAPMRSHTGDGFICNVPCRSIETLSTDCECHGMDKGKTGHELPASKCSEPSLNATAIHSFLKLMSDSKGLNKCEYKKNNTEQIECRLASISNSRFEVECESKPSNRSISLQTGDHANGTAEMEEMSYDMLLRSTVLDGWENPPSEQHDKSSLYDVDNHTGSNKVRKQSETRPSNRDISLEAERGINRSSEPKDFNVSMSEMNPLLDGHVVLPPKKLDSYYYDKYRRDDFNKTEIHSKIQPKDIYEPLNAKLSENRMLGVFSLFSVWFFIVLALYRIVKHTWPIRISGKKKLNRDRNIMKIKYMVQGRNQQGSSNV